MPPKRPAGANAIADRALHLRGKTVAPQVAIVLYDALPAAERALSCLHLPTLMPDGITKIPAATDETVQSLLYSVPIAQGGPDPATVHPDVMRLIGTAIVRWIASFEATESAPTALDAAVHE